MYAAENDLAVFNPSDDRAHPRVGYTRIWALTYAGPRMVQAETDALRRDFTPGQPQTVSWPLEVARLPAATYRTDVLLDAQCVWRGYFQLGE